MPIYLPKINVQLAPEFRGMGNTSKNKILRVKPIEYTGTVLSTRLLSKKEAVDLVTQQKENIVDTYFDRRTQSYVTRKVNLEDMIKFIVTL